MCRTIILPVVVYGCQTWSLILGEECRPKIFENRMLRRIFGPKRDEVTGEWRRLHNEELDDLYYSPNIIRATQSRRIWWAVHVARMGAGGCAYRVFDGENLGKELIWIPRFRWEDNIKMHVKGVGWKDIDWIIWLRKGSGGGMLCMW